MTHPLTLPTDAWAAPSGVALLAYTLLLAWLVVVRSRQGVRSLQALDASPTPIAQATFYRRSVLRWWTITAFVGLVLLADGVHPELGTPAGARALRIVGLVAASVVASALLAALSARVRALYRRQVGGLGLAQALLPRTPAAALRFIPVALTAGVCEELVFRGLVPYWTRHMLPAGAAYPWIPVVVSAAMFGAMHVYQGWRGVALTGALGGVLVLLTAATGSLLPAIAIHVLVDLRVALLFPVWRELLGTHDAATPAQSSALSS